MFLLDSLMIAGIQWTLKTVVAAAEAEMNDDGALRDRLLEAEMQRETGEMTDEEYEAIEADLLRAIREIKERREGGSGAFAFGGQPLETGADSRFEVEAEVTGDFYGDSHRSDHESTNIVSPSAATKVTAAAPPVRSRSSRTRTPRTRASRTIRHK